MPVENIETKSPISTRPQMPTEVPKDIKALKFDDDFLSSNPEAPEQKVTSGSGDTIIKEDGSSSKDEQSHDDVTGITKPAEVKKVEPKPEPKDTSKSEELQEKKEPTDPIEKWLKPPGQKKAEAKGEVKGKDVAGLKKPEEQSDGVKRFDYSEFTPVEAEYLKGMSSSSRAWAASIAKDVRELKKTAQTNYFQAPDAYVLDPQYKQMALEHKQVINELQFNQQQLSLIKAGKPFQYLTGIDDKTGKFTLSAPVTPDEAGEWEERMRTAINQCVSAEQGTRNKLSQYPEQFKQGVNETLAIINQERAKRFPWAQDAKYLDYGITTAEGNELSVKQIKQDFTGMFPPFLRNSPLMEVASDLMTALMMRDVEIRELQKTSSITQIKNEELKRGEPKSIEKAADITPPKVGKVKTFSLEGSPFGE